MGRCQASGSQQIQLEPTCWTTLIRLRIWRFGSLNPSQHATEPKDSSIQAGDIPLVTAAEEGAPGEDSSPGLRAIWIARAIVVQVGHHCPAVKVERPQRSEDERP
jgi:hypothetical protein